MNHVERFRAVMNFEEFDRLPRIEWAHWWDKTIDRWKGEGLPAGLDDAFEITKHLGLDPYKQFWINTIGPSVTCAEHEVLVKSFDDYNKIKAGLYPDYPETYKQMAAFKKPQENGEVVIWITLEGFFWFPRMLFGIENHLYAFYDHGELMHQMNSDLADYHIHIIRQAAEHCCPTFMTFAEDMSYNNGPMLSRDLFDEFLKPYYLKVIPVLDEYNITPIIDTDGDMTKMIPWLQEVGIKGVLPLERQAGVCGAGIREQYPDFCLIGHFDKMTMPHGYDAMKAEFDRLLPTMKKGGFIPSVDHQTPPGVSFDQYKEYLQLLDEYTLLAAK